MLKTIEKINMKKVMKITAVFLMVGVISHAVMPELYAQAPTLKSPSQIIDSGNKQIGSVSTSLKGSVQQAMKIGGLISLVVAGFGEHISKGARDAGKVGIITCVGVSMALQLF